jgi:asparagine synthase (glutamine-hydrolysing)
MPVGSTTRAFAGVFSQRRSHMASTLGARLDAALAPDGPVQRLDDGPLAVAWSHPDGPGTPDSKRTVCLLDGHVYNVGDLVEGDWPDTAAALAHLYERDGSRLLPRLRGDFALLIWDRITQTGLIARDQLGGRPLHIHDGGGSLAFASELRNITRLLPASPGPDEGAVTDWLATGMAPGDRTLFKGITTLEPASWVALARTGPSRPMRYWAPHYEAPDRVSLRQAAERVRESVFRAVTRRAGGAASTAVLLSGGIDSATVAATAAAALDEARRPQRAYTVTFPRHPEIDEAALTVDVARATGLRPTLLQLASGSVLGGALPYIDAWETPPSSPNLFFLRPLLDRAREDGTRILLDGEGGDAVFWYAPLLIADRLRGGRLLSAWSIAGRFPEYGTRTTTRARLHRLRHSGSMEHRAAAAESPAWWRSLVDGILGPGSRLLHDVSRRHAAVAGLEPRHPLLDLDLIELMLRMPPELAFDRRYNRPVVRQAMEGLVPDAVRLRPYKSRFDPVFAGAIEQDLPSIERLLCDPAAEIRGYVPPGTPQALLDSRPADPAALRTWCVELWQLAAAECWLRRISGKPALPPGARALVTATAADIASL